MEEEVGGGLFACERIFTAGRAPHRAQLPGSVFLSGLTRSGRGHSNSNRRGRGRGRGNRSAMDRTGGEMRAVVDVGVEAGAFLV